MTSILEWFNREMDRDGWKRCSEEEKCDHCGRSAQLPMSLCCADHIQDKRLLPVNDDGETVYPMPSLSQVLSRGDELSRKRDHLCLQHAQLRQAVRRTRSRHETSGTSWHVLRDSLEQQGIDPESLQLTAAELERWSEADRLRSELEAIAFDGCFGERPGNVSCDAPEIVKRCYPCRARAALKRKRE